MARKSLPSQTTMVRRLLRLYRSATPAVVAAGESWYTAAQDAAAQIYPERPDIAAGVIAALSPRCQWVTNVRWARAVVHAANTGQECPRVSTEDNRAAAWKIAQGAAPLSVLNGPKVSRFYRNIMADMDCATVDVWMMRALLTDAEIPRNRKGEMIAPRGRMYRMLEAAIQRAAAIAGISAAMMQAICWILIRGRAA